MTKDGFCYPAPPHCPALNNNSSNIGRSVNKMDDLPEEIVVKILSYLSPYRDFSAARLVCQKWHRVINTIIKSLKRELQNAVQNGDLAYTKLDFAAARPARLVRGRERELALSTSRSHPRTNFSSSYQPSPRFSHNACIAGGFLYVFGGCSLSSSSSNSTFNDLHQFDLVKKSWQRITVNRGYMPAPRECATMVAYNGKLVIFGGWCSPRSTEVTGVPKFFNDAAIVDINQRSCQEIKAVDRQIPGTRAGHGACVLKDKMIVFGGAQRILRYMFLNQTGNFVSCAGKFTCLTAWLCALNRAPLRCLYC